MYQRLFDAQKQATQNQPIHLNNPDMFYLLFLKTFDTMEIGGFAEADLAERRSPALVSTDYAPPLLNQLNRDCFVSIKAAHKIGHKLGQSQHHDTSESQAKTYLMLRQFDVSQKSVSQESELEKYPCRLSRRDWNHVNYAYPTNR